MEGKTKKWMVHHSFLNNLNLYLCKQDPWLMRSFYSRNLLDTKAKNLNSWVQVPTVDQWAKNSMMDRSPVGVSTQFLGGHIISEVPRHQMWTCLLVNINTKRTDYNQTPTLLLYTGQQSYLTHPWYQTSSWKAMDFSCWDLLSALCSYFRITFCRRVYYVCLCVTLNFQHCRNVIIYLIKQSAYG